MKVTRRRVLQLATIAAAAATASRGVIAQIPAQTYPARPVRLVHGFAAGGSGDIAARFIAQSLSDRLGQPFESSTAPARAATLPSRLSCARPPTATRCFSSNVANTINSALYEKLSFNLLTDIMPVASFMRVPNVMEVMPSLPVTSVTEFIAYAKANPGKISYASSGVGSSLHMAGELFKALAKAADQHVPYRGIGGGGLADLMAGVVHVAFDISAELIEPIRERQGSRAGGDHREAFGAHAGASHHCRVPAGL